MSLDTSALVSAGSAAGAVAAVAGLLWWLVAPRVRDYLETIVLEALQANRAQLQAATARLEAHGELLAAVVARLDGHANHLDRLDRAVSRGPIELTELADMVQLIQQHRPRHVRLADVADLERQERHP